VSDSGDHVPEMPTTPFLDDRAIEALIDGNDVAAELRPLAIFTSGVRAEGERRAPRPSPALARLIAAGGGEVSPDPDAAAGATDSLTSRRALTLAKVAGLGLVAKFTLGAGAAAAGVVGAGAAGVLPGEANHVVRDAIEVVTPVVFPHDDEPGTTPDRPDGTGGDNGDRVSPDATGESDGVSGVDGGEVSDNAPGASVRPGDPPGSDGARGVSGDPGTPPVSLPENVADRPVDPQPPAGPPAPSDGNPAATAPADDQSDDQSDGAPGGPPDETPAP
jgi:hypothetical protein